MSDRKMPWMKFYPDDWLSSPVVQCSQSAELLWFRLLILMHQSKPYGHLALRGKPMPDKIAAARCGFRIDRYRKALCELLKGDIVSRSTCGMLYSKRMQKDSLRREMERFKKQKIRDFIQKTNDQPN